MKLLKLSFAMIAATVLSSCVVPDPVFLRNAAKVSDVGYAANKIVGTWVHVSIPLVQANSDQVEHKVFLDVRPGGKGRVREVAINRSDNGRLSAEASFSWVYQGKNWWMVRLPGTAAYRVTDSYRMRLAGPYKGAANIRLRYYDGDLYDFTMKRILVPANARSVSELSNRMRRQTPTIRLNTAQ